MTNTYHVKGVPNAVLQVAALAQPQELPAAAVQLVALYITFSQEYPLERTIG